MIKLKPAYLSAGFNINTILVIEINHSKYSCKKISKIKQSNCRKCYSIENKIINRIQNTNSTDFKINGKRTLKHSDKYISS